jgi:conjugal transfer pilus assembly protein TraE
MDLAYSHTQGQRVLKQRNLLLAAVAALIALLGFVVSLEATRKNEVVLLPVLRSPLHLSSAGVSREYLELVTRDAVVLTLNRSPQNLDYWMRSVLEIASPRAEGRLKADLLKIVDEQRGSSIAQFFTIQTMQIDPKGLRSTVTGDLHTIVGNKVVSNERRTFQYDWEYSGVSLRLAGFGMVTPVKGAQR